MSNDKVLFISQEIKPYLPDSEMSIMGHDMPHGMQERGYEVRTFMSTNDATNCMKLSVSRV